MKWGIENQVCKRLLLQKLRRIYFRARRSPTFRPNNYFNKHQECSALNSLAEGTVYNVRCSERALFWSLERLAWCAGSGGPSPRWSMAGQAGAVWGPAGAVWVRLGLCGSGWGCVGSGWGCTGSGWGCTGPGTEPWRSCAGRARAEPRPPLGKLCSALCRHRAAAPGSRPHPSRGKPQQLRDVSLLKHLLCVVKSQFAACFRFCSPSVFISHPPPHPPPPLPFWFISAPKSESFGRLRLFVFCFIFPLLQRSWRLSKLHIWCCRNTNCLLFCKPFSCSTVLFQNNRGAWNRPC